MKKLFLSAVCVATALMAISCAKEAKSGPNDANKRYLDAWLQVNGITTAPSGLGIYILEEEKGSGRGVDKDGFAFIDYTTYDLEGNVGSTTSAEVSKQLGTYSESSYYGPKFITTHSGTIYAGVYDMLKDMKVGGRKKVIIPSWLMSYKSYDDPKEYLNHTTSSTDLIYDVTLRDFTDSISRWEIDSIGRFFTNDKIMIDGKPVSEIFAGVDVKKDTVDANGFYYKQLGKPASTTEFASDTTIYINYTGRTLDGKVFDTTNEKIAKDNNIYSSSRSYEPVLIKWPGKDEEFTEITMGSGETSVINGFALTLWQMHPMEKGVGVFYSVLGYGNSGSGNSIPSYAPLMFEIEIVAKPED